MAGAWAKAIMAAMPALPASRATGWCAVPDRHDDGRDHGHRHGRLYGHAVHHGARAPGRAAGRWRDPGHRCRRRRRVDRHRASCRSSATAWRPRPAVPRKRLSSRVSVHHQSSTAMNSQAPAKPLGKTRWAGAVDVGRLVDARQCPLADHAGRRRLPPAAWRRAWIFRARSRPSSCAASSSSASIRSPRSPAAVEAWSRLARDLDLAKLASLTRHATLDEVPSVAADIVAGKMRGRVVIDL